MVTSGRAVLDLSLPAEPSTPRRARSAVAEQFGDHPRCGDVLVCVSEAVTNAVLHAGSGVRVVVRDTGDALRIEVSDTSPTLPVARDPGPETPTGRGLLLIDRLASEWGVDAHDSGKTLWFEVRR
jgi:anti-sigma regulatory factor (Ser/Thr protein kinase)